MVCAVPFQYQEHMLTVPVVLGDVETTFIFDTGIGINLISPDLAAKVSCVPLDETYGGRRMSGQAVAVPMSTLSSLKLGDFTRENVAVGVFDLAGIAGLVSLTNFRSTPVTIDYEAGAIVIEDERSFADRLASGTSVAINVHEDGPFSTDVYIDLTLPGGRSVKVEVDTGSDTLILNQPFAAQNAIDLEAESTRRLLGHDETGHEYARYFTILPGSISLTGASAFRQHDPQVMFQKIIYDGLIGDAFLRNFVTTYDLANSRMIFAPR
ncbi:MAG TPA: pepsin/retropepsin-like aspartic protease family protein [Streptosporangiaceae bacterium]|jgi:predicted aspartyl protease